MWFVYTHNICTNRFTICKIRAMWIYIIIAYKLQLLWTGRVKTWNERKCSSSWLACTNYIKLWQYIFDSKKGVQTTETRDKDSDEEKKTIHLYNDNLSCQDIHTWPSFFPISSTKVGHHFLLNHNKLKQKPTLIQKQHAFN